MDDERQTIYAKDILSGFLIYIYTKMQSKTSLRYS